MATLRFWLIFSIVVGAVFFLGGLAMTAVGAYLIATRHSAGVSPKIQVDTGLALLLPGEFVCAVVYQLLAWLGAKIGEADAPEVPQEERFRCCVHMQAHEVLLWCTGLLFFGGGGIAMIVFAFVLQSDDGNQWHGNAIALLVVGPLLLCTQAVASIAWCVKRCEANDEESRPILPDPSQ